jgi:hypothetical protein
MATGHAKANEEGYGTLNEGYFHLITCTCGAVIEEGPRRSAEDAKTAASAAWNLHLLGE